VSPARPTITLENLSGKPIRTAPLHPFLLAALKLQKIRTGNWTLTLVTNRAMAALHKKTMAIPTTTDVLTFDLRPSLLKSQISNLKSLKLGGGLDLDTVISADVAAREAKLRHHPLAHEILLYAIHSLLHVTGHDDLTEADAARMHAREDHILRALGLPPVYAVPQKTSRSPHREKTRKQPRPNS
jgi:probable rRNA maturation factor